jgi:hypothetical protein
MRLSHLVGAALGTGLLFLVAAGGAQAYDHDRDHWRHEEWRHGEWHRDHRYEGHHVHERPVVVHEHPVYVERARPVFVPPAPVYAAPMYAAPMYQQNQGPSGLNLNFNIPLN